MKKGFTLLELLIAMGVMISTFAVLAIITYDLTSQSQLVIKRLDAISNIDFVNLKIIQIVQKAGPEPKRFLTVNSSSIRYEVVVPFSEEGHLTEQLTVESSKILVQQKDFSSYDFDESSSPVFTYISKIPFNGGISTVFQNMTLGELSYELIAKAPRKSVNYSTNISLINIK